MLKFEKLAAVGQKIKAYNFPPMPGREDSFVQGTIVAKGDIMHPEYNTLLFKGYTIFNELKDNEETYIPFENMFMEYDNRIELL